MGLFDFLSKNKDKDKDKDKKTTTSSKPSTTTAKPAATTAKPAATTAKPAATTAKPAATTAAKPVAATVKPTGELQVVIDGKPIKFSDGKPYVEGNDVMVPIRELSTHLGAKVDWDPATKTATLSKDDDKVEVVTGATTAKVNGKTVPIGAVATLKNERIFLPIKFLAEGLDASYKYDAANKIASIS